MEISRFTDIHCREELMPFTLTRHTAEIRVGMFTIKEKWEHALTLFPDLNLPLSIPADIIPGFDFFSLLNEKSWDEVISEKHLYRVLRHPWEISLYNDWALRQDYAMAVNNRETAPISNSVKITGSANIFLEKGVTAEHCFINAIKWSGVYISGCGHHGRGNASRTLIHRGRNRY